VRRRDLPFALLAAAAMPPFFTSACDSTETPKADEAPQPDETPQADEVPQADETPQADYYPRTLSETTAGVSPKNYAAPPGSWRRYGADPTGQADSTSAIAAACLANPTAFDDVGGSYRVSGAIHIPSGCAVSGIVGRTQILMDNPDTSLLVAISTAGVIVEGIRFLVTAPSLRASMGVVVFFNSSGGHCRHCDFSGFSWAGVWIYDSTNCEVTQCTFHDAGGSVQDSADICIYNNSHDNVVSHNDCFGGNYHGILIQDPYNNALPSRNVVTHNAVANHLAYGICVYLPDAGDTYNRIVGNKVEGIRGSPFRGASGSGIYVVGAGAGGTVIDGNSVASCCLETFARIESPGAIGVHGLTASNASVSIVRNVVSQMARYDGIILVLSQAEVTIVDNRVTLLAGNVEGTPIRVDTSSNVLVKANHVSRPTSDGRCILVYASGGIAANVTVSGNTCLGGNYNQIDFLADLDGAFASLTCEGNLCTEGGVARSAVSINASSVRGGVIRGNRCNSVNAVALRLIDTVDCVISGNTFNSGGPVSVAASGDCHGTYYASDNKQNGKILNSAMGLDVGP